MPYEKNLFSMIISSTRSSNWNAPSLKLQRGAAHTCFRSSVTFFRKQLGSILHISYEKCIVVSVSTFQSVLNAEKTRKEHGCMENKFSRLYSDRDRGTRGRNHWFYGMIHWFYTNHGAWMKVWPLTHEHRVKWIDCYNKVHFINGS